MDAEESIVLLTMEEFPENHPYVKEKQMKPGDIFSRIDKCNVIHLNYLVLLLSSDREPGIEYCQDSIYRCAQFMLSSADYHLLGAQIVLYTEAELKLMTPVNNLGHITYSTGSKNEQKEAKQEKTVKDSNGSN